MDEREKRQALVELREGFEKGFVSSGNRVRKYGKSRVPEGKLLRNYVPARRPLRTRHPWGDWTAADDEQLRDHVLAQTGSVSWRRAAELFGKRFSADEVRRRWTDSVMLRLGKRGPWQSDEIRGLVDAVRHCWDAETGRVSSWTDVMVRLGSGRVAPHCRQRWVRLQRCLAKRLRVAPENVTPVRASKVIEGVFPDLDDEPPGDDDEPSGGHDDDDEGHDDDDVRSVDIKI